METESGVAAIGARAALTADREEIDLEENERCFRQRAPTAEKHAKSPSVQAANDPSTATSVLASKNHLCRGALLDREGSRAKEYPDLNLKTMTNLTISKNN